MNTLRIGIVLLSWGLCSPLMSATVGEIKRDLAAVMRLDQVAEADLPHLSDETERVQSQRVLYMLGRLRSPGDTGLSEDTLIAAQSLLKHHPSDPVVQRLTPAVMVRYAYLLDLTGEAGRILAQALAMPGCHPVECQAFGVAAYNEDGRLAGATRPGQSDVGGGRQEPCGVVC